MTTQSPQGTPHRSKFRGRLLTTLLLAGVAWSAHVLVQTVQRRVSLILMWGGSYWVVVGALAAGTLLLLVACAREVRAGKDGRTRSFAAFRLLFCFLVGSVAISLAFLQPFRKLQADLTLALCMGGFGLALNVGPVITRHLPRRMLRGLDLVLFNLCLVLVLTELGLRGVAWIRPSPLYARAQGTAVERLRNQRFTPGEVRLGFPTNSGGYYDRGFLPFDERSGPAVVMIGDSFSSGMVPHHYHFTTVGERELGEVEIYNMGLPGLGPHEYLHLLRHETLPLRPDVIAVNLFVGNDITDTSPRESDHPGWRRWFDRENCLLYLVPSRLRKLSREGLVDAQPGSPEVETPEELERVYPWLTDELRETPTFTRETFLTVETRRALEVCGSRRSHFQRVFELIKDMQRAAGSTPFVIVLIPDEFQVEDDLWRQVRARVDGIALERAQPQRLLGDWLKAHDVPFLDLLPALRAVPVQSDGKRHCYHLMDTHFNARGNRVAGKEMARFLRTWLE
ncbi:MAG: hypothetical protein CMJ83_01275 [Planctomycetes bacterium]|nr:hypothetical protein [Planctomycetota bacterium]